MSNQEAIEAARAARNTVSSQKHPLEDTVVTSLRIPTSIHDALTDIVYTERKRGNRISIHSLILEGVRKTVELLSSDWPTPIMKDSTPHGVFPSGRWSLDMNERPDLWERIIRESPPAMKITPQIKIKNSSKKHRGKALHKPAPRLDNVEYLTANEFCRLVRFSRSKFNVLQAEKNGPKITRLGMRKIIISRADANEWIASLPKSR